MNAGFLDVKKTLLYICSMNIRRLGEILQDGSKEDPDRKAVRDGNKLLATVETGDAEPEIVDALVQRRHDALCAAIAENPDHAGDILQRWLESTDTDQQAVAMYRRLHTQE